VIAVDLLTPGASVGAGREAAVGATLGEIDGRPVARFRLEGGKHRGALGPPEAESMARIIHLAREGGVPIVGVISSSGADVREGIASLHGWGQVANQLAQASGIVPIVLTLIGPCV
jgi:propionyl-CoA carboxylase beta chain